MKSYLVLAMMAVLQGSCVSHTTSNPESTCDTGQFVLSGSYPGARLGTCTVVDENHVVLLNAPEDTPPINHSPWYGFKVQGGPGSLHVRINYTVHQHRYWPKIRIDDNSREWSRLSEEQVNIVNEGRSVEINLRIDNSPVWISAQENLVGSWYEDWLANIVSNVSGVKLGSIGSSRKGRDIYVLQTNPNASDVLLLVGRQHPPEVTGALALRAFTDKLMEGHSDDCVEQQPLCAFFAKTNVILIPNLNPDGVELGHWRNGTGHIDLNRDWGIFSQPETRAVETLINHLVKNGKRIRLFLDFHSTRLNLFYTQSEGEQTVPKGFATRWLEMSNKYGVYDFSHQPRHNEGSPTSKNYMYARFGIPAITYEVGDEMDREEITKSARVFATTMIEALGDID